METPLVTISIPTYNRESTLPKTIESVLSQTYTNLEIIIGDNASTDSTERLSKHYSSLDNRIRYVRHSENLGATGNFNKLLELASGEFFMWLADDDWIDDSYINNCLSFLLSHKDYSLVCGRGVLYRDGVFWKEDYSTNIEESEPKRRVVFYYKTVESNSCFYGLTYTSILRELGGIQDILSADWLLVASLAYLGKVKSISESAICKEMSGHSSTMSSLLHLLKLPPILAHFYLYLLYQAWIIFSQTLWKDRTYWKLTIPVRFILAIELFLVITLRSLPRKILKILG
jgi:glycosyltransferase domain-containing protein